MEAILEAVPRDTFGKNEARRTRRQGMVPAVLYGASPDPQQKTVGTPIAVNPKALLKILHSESGANTLISLKLAGAGARVLVREYQLDPVTHQVLHADFYRVAMDRALQVTIPVIVKGEPKGVKQQGGVSSSSAAVRIECLGRITEHVESTARAHLPRASASRHRDDPKGSRQDRHGLVPIMRRREVAAPRLSRAAVAAGPEVINKARRTRRTREEIGYC